MWLINAIKGKMIRKWVVLNIFISFIIIMVVGYSIKEFACYQFNLYSHSSGQSEQFRNMIETYLLYAGILAFILAVVIHLFFARRILKPLHRLTHSDDTLAELRTVTSQDEVGQIANDIIHISKQMNNLQKQNEQMLADIAHELRTPLTTLNGYLDGLKDGVFSFDESTSTLLQQECERLISFIERIQQFHEWEQVDIVLTKMHMSSFLHSVLKEYESAFKKAGLRININIKQQELHSDPKALRTIMYELLDNVHYYNVGKDVFITGYVDDGHYFVSISNAGKPIPVEDQHHVFEQFYRAEPSRNRNTGGAGLGLAIAKQIVLRLQGKIDYHSNDKMNTFQFSIPIDQTFD